MSEKEKHPTHMSFCPDPDDRSRHSAFGECEVDSKVGQSTFRLSGTPCSEGDVEVSGDVQAGNLDELDHVLAHLQELRTRVEAYRAETRCTDIDAHDEEAPAAP